MAKKLIPAYRQGDVILVRVSDKEDHAEAHWFGKDAGDTLREGEVTGHAHRIGEGSLATLIESKVPARSKHSGENRIRRFLDVKGKAEIVHEEHGTIVPEPGLYEVIQQREFVADYHYRPVVD